MSAAVRLRVNKEFLYRGQVEQWSNTYHLSSTGSLTTTQWDNLVTAWIAAEKAIYDAAVTIVGFVGYNGGSNVANYTRDLHVLPDVVVAGTLGVTHSSSVVSAPGDAAAWIRYDTGRTSSRGKRIFMRNYYHGTLIAPPDVVQSTQKTAYGTFATALEAGLGSLSLKIADQNGVVTVGHGVTSYITTRTLKRRGNSPL